MIKIWILIFILGILVEEKSLDYRGVGLSFSSFLGLLALYFAGKPGLQILIFILSVITLEVIRILYKKRG